MELILSVNLRFIMVESCYMIFSAGKSGEASRPFQFTAMQDYRGRRYPSFLESPGHHLKSANIPRPPSPFPIYKPLGLGKIPGSPLYIETVGFREIPSCLKDLEKFRAPPLYRGNGIWKNPELSPLYMLWDLEKFQALPFVHRLWVYSGLSPNI